MPKKSGKTEKKGNPVAQQQNAKRRKKKAVAEVGCKCTHPKTMKTT
jgi:hypothetical protein